MAQDLTHEAIVNKAIAVIEKDGEAALSIRGLARHFGVTPMALYHYFSNRDELLIAVIESVSAGIEIPPPTGDPINHAGEVAMCLHEFLTAQPWTIRLIPNGQLASKMGLRITEEFFNCAFAVGLDEHGAFIFYRAMLSLVLGQAALSAAGNKNETLPQRHRSDAPPTVATLADRWPELSTAALPERIYHATAKSLLSHNI